MGRSATYCGEQTGNHSGGEVRRIRVLELGTWEGNSAAWLASHLAFREGAELVCVDTFAGGQEHVTCHAYSRELQVFFVSVSRFFALFLSLSHFRARARALSSPP